MKYLRRKWLAIPLGLVLLVVVTLVLAVAYIRSEAGSNRALEYAKVYLAKNQNTQLTFEKGRVDPLTGLHFKNLKIVREEPPVSATILIESLDIGYELSLLKRRVDINEFKVIHPQITARVDARNEAPTPTPTPSTGGKSLDEMIHDPPVQISLREMAVENLDLDVTQLSPTGEVSALVKGLDTHLHFEMLKDQFKISGDLNTGSGASVKQKSKVKDEATSLAMKVSAEGKWDVDIHREAKGWIYSVKPTSWKSTLRSVQMQSASPKAQMEVALPSANMNATFELSARSQELFKLDRDSVELVKVNGKLEAAKLTLEQLTRDADKTTKQITTIDSQTATFVTGLANNQIALETKYGANNIVMAPTILKPVDAVADFRATLPRDLMAVALDGNVTLAGLPLLLMKANGSRESSGAMALKGNLKLEADPKLAAFIKPAAQLKKTGKIEALTDFDVHRQADGAIDAKVKSDIPKIVLPSLSTPATIQLNSAANLDAKQSNLKLKTAVGMQNAQLGDWTVDSDLETSLPPPNAAPSKLPAIKGRGRTLITEIRAASGKPLLPAVFGKPMTITHDYDLAAKPGSVAVEADLPMISVPGTANLRDTKVKFAARSADFAAARDIDVTADVSQGPIDFDKALAEKAVKQISGAAVKLVANLRGGEDVTVDELTATVDGQTIQVNAQAAGNIKTKNLQANALLVLKVPENFPPLGTASVRGIFDIPVSINLLRGRELSLIGAVNARGLSVKQGAIAASGIAGKFPFNEKLIIEDKDVRFASLITQNPFERVDFERVRPLLQGSEQFRIETIQWEEKTYGPFVGFFSLRQNVIYAHQFDMDVGSGRLSGELFFDAYPKNLQLGSLSRLTNVNLGEVLPQKFLARAPGGDKNISGRSGFVLNLNRGTIDGRIDVTEIGGAQLIALANILDPAYEDEKLNKIRTLLQVGYPTQVQMEFAEGYLNMEIGLRVLGINQRQVVRGIPISSLLSTATSDTVRETEKGPLK